MNYNVLVIYNFFLKDQALAENTTLIDILMNIKVSTARLFNNYKNSKSSTIGQRMS